MKWVEVNGTREPKEQLENAIKEMNELLDEQKVQFYRLKEKVKNLNSDLHLDELLFWEPVLRKNGSPEIADIAVTRIDECCQKILNEECSISEMADLATVYYDALAMPEKSKEIMDDIASYNCIDSLVALAELNLKLLGDSMSASEYYCMADEAILNLRDRCFVALSIFKNYDEEWGFELYHDSFMNELEIADFETLFETIGIIEELDIDLADEAKIKLFELAQGDKKKLAKLAKADWASDYECEIILKAFTD